MTLVEPIYPILVWEFYVKARFYAEGSISYLLRRLEIQLDVDKNCRVLGVLAVGLRVYEFKSWPTIPDFLAGEVIQHLCGLPDGNKLGNHLTTI